MRTGAHFTPGSSGKHAAAATIESSKLLMGSNSFGARSAKGQGLGGMMEPSLPVPPPATTGLTEAALAAHTKRLALVAEEDDHAAAEDDAKST